MKNLLLLILCCTALSLAAQTNYPSGGVFVQCDFNNSTKDNKAMLSFISLPDSAKTFVAGANGTANGALRFGYGGDRGLTKLKEPFATIPQSSLVITLKINNLREEKDHSLFSSSLREVVVNGEGKLRAKVQRSKKSDKKDVFDFDLGIKPGEWVTIVAMWDNKAEKVTYWANGKYCEVNNVRLSEYIPDDQYSQSASLMGYCEGDVDEFILYKRHLTETELQALCGAGQPFEKVEAERLEAKPMVNWKWAIFQLIFAVFCIFVLNRQRKRLKPVTEESIRDAHRATFDPENAGAGPSGIHAAARAHLWNAFNYWKEQGKTKEKDATYADMLHVAGAEKLKYETANAEDYYRYPVKKKYMKESLAEFNKALQMGCAEPDVVEELNLYVRCYNAAHKRIYDGKWWIIAIAVACVYVHGLVPSISFGILDTDKYAAFPDGFFPQIGYLTKYLLPGVLFSIVAYCATSFAVRYQNRRGQYVMPSELKNDINLKDVATYAGKPLLGSLAALGAVGLGIAAAIYGIVNAVGTAKMDKVVYKSAMSGRVLRTGSELSATGMGSIMFAFFAFAAVLFAVYFISNIIIGLFSVLFIYNAIKNYIVRT